MSLKYLNAGSSLGRLVGGALAAALAAATAAAAADCGVGVPERDPLALLGALAKGITTLLSVA